MKIENAYSRFLAVLDRLERQPHVYGESDCIMRVGWLSAAQVGEEKRAAIVATIDKYHGRYRSMAEAIAVLEVDGLTPLSLVGSFFDEIEISEAVAGDICALRQGGPDWGFGVFDRGHIHVATETGTGILPRRAAEKAFRVE